MVFAVGLSKTMMEHKASSTAYLSLFFVLMVAYICCKVLWQIKTKNGTQEANMPLIIDSLKRVVEVDMAPGFLYLVIAVTFGAFYGFMAFIGYAYIACAAGLTIAYAKQNYKLILVLRILNVLLVVIGFLVVFADELHMDAHKIKRA